MVSDEELVSILASIAVVIAIIASVTVGICCLFCRKNHVAPKFPDDDDGSQFDENWKFSLSTKRLNSNSSGNRFIQDQEDTGVNDLYENLRDLRNDPNFAETNIYASIRKESKVTYI